MAKFGRSLLSGECTVDEFRALTRPFQTAKHYIRDEMDSYAYDSAIIEGDLELDELNTFKLNISRLVVTGNLTVTGLYQDYDDPETCVCVLGNMTAGNAITNGALCVAGNLTVRESLVGYYNDHGAEILGDLTARAFAPENHHFSIGGAFVVDHVIGSNAEYRVSPKHMNAATPDEAVLRTVIVPEIVSGGIPEDPEEVLDFDNTAIRKRVAQGLPLLRGDAPQPSANKPPEANNKKPATAKKKPATKKKPAPTKKKPAPKKKKPAPKKKKPAPKKKKKR